eukprot:scaffold23928_cov54-Attheya_sp.AAC.1
MTFGIGSTHDFVIREPFAGLLWCQKPGIRRQFRVPALFSTSIQYQSYSDTIFPGLSDPVIHGICEAHHDS